MEWLELNGLNNCTLCKTIVSKLTSEDLYEYEINPYKDHKSTKTIYINWITLVWQML